MGSVMDAINGGVKLKKATIAPKPAPSSGGGMGSVMDAISSGVKLKSAANRPLASKPEAGRDPGFRATSYSAFIRAFMRELFLWLPFLCFFIYA